MLILGRRVDECIVIGDDIEIMVVSILGGKVRLGVTAPSTVSVDRKEVRLDKTSLRTVIVSETLSTKEHK